MKQHLVPHVATSATSRAVARQPGAPNSILQLQRLAGNAAVAQLIGSQAVQRKDPPAKGKSSPKSAFEARLVPDPRQGATQLGGVYTQSVTIENAAEAPKGTKFQWRYDMRPGTFSPTGKAVLEGPSSSYPMIIRTVGENFLVPAVYSTVPGHDKEVDTTAVTIVVPQPQLKRSKVETEANGKRRPVFDSMIVGEDLIVTIELDQIDKQTVDAAPHSFVQVPGLEHVRTAAVAPGVYEIHLHASNVLGALGTVAVLPFDTQLGQVPVVAIRVDVEPKDSTATPDTRPVDLAGAKSWLHDDYTTLFQQLRLGNDALVRQSEVNDPPPKSPLWIEILLGAATAALGGVSAAIGMTIAHELVGTESERLHETIKVFFEQTLATSATAALKDLGTDPTETTDQRSPHLRFFTAHQTALNMSEQKMKQEELTNRVEPRIDALEKEEPGKGFRAAMELDRGLKAAIPEAEATEFEKSFVEWVNFVTRGQLGTVNKDVPDAATDMSQQLSTSTEGYPTRGDQSAAGVIAIEVEGDTLGKPDVPVTIDKSYMHGMNQTLRAKIGTYAVRDLPFALTVRGNAPGRFDGPWSFARNENGTMWLSDETHEYLERKGQGTARDGANKILYNEIGGEKLKPEA